MKMTWRKKLKPDGADDESDYNKKATKGGGVNVKENL